MSTEKPVLPEQAGKATASSLFRYVDRAAKGPVIKVIGIGGAGGNAVAHMCNSGIQDVEFLCANTDRQDLDHLQVQKKIALGEKIAGGLGAGADPEVGRKSAQESRDEIAAALEGADMVFIAAGMGGGTGTGASPVVAEVARDLDCLTVAVVTRPFDYERRTSAANTGIGELSQIVDSLVVIPNEKLLTALPETISCKAAFACADDVLAQAVRGISEIITRPGYVNLDFADVRRVMARQGISMIGTGVASGENRALHAAQQAVANPLIEEVNISSARSALVNICSGEVGLREFNQIMDYLGGYLRNSNDESLMAGMFNDESMGGELRVTLILAGIEDAPAEHVAAAGGNVSSLTMLRSHETGDGHVDAAQSRQARNLLDVPAFLRNQAD